MEITETRVKLVNNANDRLKAYCSITIDGCFVVRDLKVIDGSNGLFVAMPSRKLATRCPNCSSKNHLRARFCNECGKKTSDGRSDQTNARTKLHADVAHPINAECRQFIQERVIAEFQVEAERSRQPDYVAAEYDDYEDNDENDESPYNSLIQELKAEQQTGRKERHLKPMTIEEPEVASEPCAESESEFEPESEPESELEAESELATDLEPEPEPERQPAAAEVETPAGESGDDDFGVGL